jgi:tetratricopeptide (TPR) repeat protein
MAIYADLRQPESAAQVASEYRDWVDTHVPSEGALGAATGAIHAKLLTALGDVYDRCDDSEQAYVVFQEGLKLLIGVPEVDEVVGILGQLHFNSANMLAKLGRYEEAQHNYEVAAKDLSTLGDSEALLRIRYAIVFLHYKQGRFQDLHDELVDFAEKYESALEHAESRNQAVIRQGLDRVYRLWLRFSAEQIDTSDARATILFFHQLFALKEEEGKLSKIWKQEAGKPDATIHSEISVLLDRVDQRQGMGVLVIEQVPDAILVVTFRGGSGAWNSRVHIALLENEGIEAVKTLLLEHRDTVRSLAERSMPVRSRPSSRFTSACANAWNALTPEIQQDIIGVNTLMVSVDNQTQLDELPLELLHDGTTYLGIRTDIVWAPALRDLNILLGENHLNAAPTQSALIVRAQDELPQANTEANRVSQALEDMEIHASIRAAPKAADLLDELGKGIDLLHYIGHGLADEIGEILPLGPAESLSAREVAAIYPAPAPLTILSACLTGRGRQLRTGHQQGFATALLRRGAAAVVAAKYFVPDHIATEYATLLYHFAPGGTLQNAVRKTRALLAEEGYHPAAWSCFAVFGRPDVRIQAPHRCDATTWPSAAFRYLATGSDSYLEDAQRLLEQDQRLSNAQKLQMQKDLAALGSADPHYFSVDKMKEKSSLDEFSEGMLAGTMVRAFGTMRHAASTVGADFEQVEREVIQQALLAESILGDTYLLVAAATEMCRRTEFYRQGQGKDILLRATRRLQWLSADELALDDTRSVLEKYSKLTEQQLYFDISTLAGVDDETFRAADSGDRSAQKKMLKNLLTSEASPESLTSGHWTDWMLRMIATGEKQATSDLLGSIDQAARTGGITIDEQRALNELIEQYFGPDEVDPGTARTALATFQGQETELSVLELFFIHDRLASGADDVSLEQIWDAVEQAKRLKAKGATAYFQAVWAERAAQDNRLHEALDAGKEAVEAYQRLVPNDPEYEQKLGMTALLTAGIADACGNHAVASFLRHQHRDSIAAFQSSEVS